MSEIEDKILLFLESGYNIDMILKELNMDGEHLANTIIELEDRELIILENKNWILAQKGKDILKEAKAGLLKKLKIEYLYGNISKDEFQRKRKELELIVERHRMEDKTENKKLEDEQKMNCPKCGKENKTGSKYCSKCGEPLKSI